MQNFELMYAQSILTQGMMCAPLADARLSYVDARDIGAVAVEPNRDQLTHIGALIDAGHIRPFIAGVLPLSQARQAYEQGLRGHMQGKMVLRIVD